MTVSWDHYVHVQLSSHLADLSRLLGLVLDAGGEEKEEKCVEYVVRCEERREGVIKLFDA